MRIIDYIRCWTAPRWVFIDPTGGDPWMGGPVTIEVCAACQVERGFH